MASMSISPFLGRRIAGSKACRRAGVSCSRSACPAPQRPNSGGRHSDRGAALRIERRGDAYAARAVSTAYFVCAEGEFEADREEVERLRAAFDAGGIDTVRSLIWKRPALSDRCWFAGKDWALSRDETP